MLRAGGGLVGRNQLYLRPCSLKPAELAGHWIHHKCDLALLLEELGLNELVVVREEDAEAWVGVVPTDNLLARELLFPLFEDCVPDIVGEGQGHQLLAGLEGRNKTIDLSGG